MGTHTHTHTHSHTGTDAGGLPVALDTQGPHTSNTELSFTFSSLQTFLWESNKDSWAALTTCSFVSPPPLPAPPPFYTSLPPLLELSLPFSFYLSTSLPTYTSFTLPLSLYRSTSLSALSTALLISLHLSTSFFLFVSLSRLNSIWFIGMNGEKLLPRFSTDITKQQIVTKRVITLKQQHWQWIHYEDQLSW